MPASNRSAQNRPGAATKGQLKEFKVERVKARYKVTCPKCLENFWVRFSWKRSSEYKTRPCPYCWKTSKVPQWKRTGQ